MKRDIEFVCSGNNGRSPVAEATAINVLRDCGYTNEVTVSSSGTDVDFPTSIVTPDFIRPYAQQGLEKGVLTTKQFELVDTNPLELLHLMIATEEKHRQAYLEDLLGYTPEHIPKQTIARPQAQCIFPMDYANFVKVKDIYAPTKHSPEIIQLDEFTGLSGDLEDSWPCTQEEYRVTASKVEAATRAAMSRILDRT